MLAEPFAVLTGCYVSTGGFIERVLSASAGNKAVVSKYLTACKNLGCVLLVLSGRL